MDVADFLRHRVRRDVHRRVPVHAHRERVLHLLSLLRGAVRGFVRVPELGNHRVRVRSGFPKSNGHRSTRRAVTRPSHHHDKCNRTRASACSLCTASPITRLTRRTLSFPNQKGTTGSSRCFRFFPRWWNARWRLR